MSAKSFTTDAIRNVVFLGHGGTGKTTLVDAMCFSAGATTRKGLVADGTAVTDFTAEEKDHTISVNTAVAHAVWQDVKINLIDTPGYLDFAGDAKAGVRVADGAVILVDATAGVLVGTENSWEYCEERGIPRILVVSMMDKENANFDSVMSELHEEFSKDVVPLEIPIGSGEGFRGVVDLLSSRARIFDPKSKKGEYKEENIPAELQDACSAAYQELVEAIAATDDALMEEYFEKETIEPARAAEVLKAAMKAGLIYPVVCAAPERGYGARGLLERVVDIMPSPAEAVHETAKDGEAEVELSAADDGPLAALIFKTTSEPHVGELSYFRVFSGSVDAGASAKNTTRGGSEKLGHPGVPQGKDRAEVAKIHAGDIGVVAKLRDTHTGDTLSAENRSLVLEGIAFPDSDISVAVRPAKRGDEDKVSTGLHKIHEEDPTFTAAYDPELGQTIARGLGEMHLELAIERVNRRFGVEVQTEAPRIPYRETFTKTAEGQGRYKKQTGGRGQYGDCWVRLSPLPPGSGYEFKNAIVGGVIPGKFVPSVDKGVQEAAQKGVVAGYHVVDFQAEVYDGSHHSVDSSDIAFKVAGSLAFKNVAPQAGPILLEPIYEVEVTVPDEYMGDVMGDLNQRRGKILGMEPKGKKQVVRAQVPLNEMHRYSSTLRSITQGRGSYKMKFFAYEQAPPNIVEKVKEEAAAREEEEKK
ncbi:MAG: elongation factor G [Gemmatimonadetes bacterium]|nr:elongation factor G [Gemmatimonadota bacterium]NIO31595.1 elongation factor G [Gemmatimonadota bacterium]